MHDTSYDTSTVTSLSRWSLESNHLCIHFTLGTLGQMFTRNHTLNV
jgi:hypothetical protein